MCVSWNERCGTDLFAGTFAGSVPEPACISQLCESCDPAEKPEKPHSRSVRGGFAKRVRAMAIVRRYRSTSRKAGVLAMAIPPQNGATATHGSALPRSLAIFSFWAECVDVIVVPWDSPRISRRCREKWIARILEGVNRSFRIDGRTLVIDGRSGSAPVVEKSTSLDERLWGKILRGISWSHRHILR